MITHTGDSHQIPSQKKTESKLQILEIVKDSNFEILQATLHTTHLLKLLDKMYKYEMDLIRTVGALERTRNAGWTDGQTDGVKPIDTPPPPPATTTTTSLYNDECCENCRTAYANNNFISKSESKSVICILMGEFQCPPNL